MNKFEKQLEKWNDGVLRGAQAKLAKILGVSTATTALWTTGKRHPSKGYISRMAELFHLSADSVQKLFDTRSTTYPDPKYSHIGGTLRDQSVDEYIYGFAAEHAGDEIEEASNSVRLPFLNAIPENYPHYDESEIIEWWSVPRRYAQGAKYIVRAHDAGFADAADADDLCFIRPGKEILPGKTVLIAEKKHLYCTKTVKNKDKKTFSYTNQEYPSILGTVVRRIRSV